MQIKVIGKVQGVWFRASTKDRADNLSLKGWVRNEADGSVQIEVHGPVNKVEKFQDWCKIGSKHSRVDQLQIHKIEFKEYPDFSILRKHD